MFKKSRRKIVAAVLFVLVLVLSGTFCIIYLASYVDMTNENRKLLEQYVNTYSLQGPQLTDPSEEGMSGTGGAEEKSGIDDAGDPPIRKAFS